jgi:uncharacterized protein YjbI with pentapeptide repeats
LPLSASVTIGGATLEGCNLQGTHGTPLNAATAIWRGAHCPDGVLLPTSGSPTCAGHFLAP